LFETPVIAGAAKENWPKRAHAVAINKLSRKPVFLRTPQLADPNFISRYLSP
jgi:hypothetical protein